MLGFGSVSALLWQQSADASKTAGTWFCPPVPRVLSWQRSFFWNSAQQRCVTEGVWQSIKCYLWYSPSSRKIWMRFILSRIECPELMYNSPPVLWKRKRKKLLRFPQLKWCIFQKSLLFYEAGFISEAIRQRLIGSHRRGFTQLSQQTTDRDYHLGGDISFLCQLVNRWSL